MTSKVVDDFTREDLANECYAHLYQHISLEIDDFVEDFTYNFAEENKLSARDKELFEEKVDLFRTQIDINIS